MSAHVAAYVSEEVDYDENGWPCATGLFSVSVQAEESGELAASPARLGLADAVAFAAGHADRIIVRVSDRWECTSYSAGPDRVDGLAPLPAGLKLARRRAPGWEFVDRSPSDPAIEWDVKVIAGQRRGEPVRDYPQRFAHHLQRDASVRCVGWVAYPGGGITEATIEAGGGWVIAAGGTPAAGARLRLTAATESEARTLAERVARAAGRAALRELGLPVDDGVFAWQWTAHAYPADTIVAQINATQPAVAGRPPPDRRDPAASVRSSGYLATSDHTARTTRERGCASSARSTRPDRRTRAIHRYRRAGSSAALS